MPYDNTSSFPAASTRWQQSAWGVVLIIVSLAGSLYFACAMPFAALAVAAALLLPFRTGLAMIVTAWACNQAIGYGLLNYPQTYNSALWGLAIGIAAVASYVMTVKTIALSKHGADTIFVWVKAFVISIITYESVLFVTALTPLGGLEDFSLAIISRIVGVNLLALVLIYGISRLAASAGWVRMPSAALPLRG